MKINQINKFLIYIVLVLCGILMFQCHHKQSITETLITQHNKRLIQSQCKECVCYNIELEHYVKRFNTKKITLKKCDILLKEIVQEVLK